MKTAILSDCHITHRYKPRLFLALKKLIETNDMVILNGDFFDLYISTVEEIRQSPWKNLFPLLKSMKAIYIRGNHDATIQKRDLWGITLTDSYELETPKATLKIEHGHRIEGERTLRANFKKNRNLLKYGAVLQQGVETIARGRVRPLYDRTNQILEREAAKNLEESEILVAGHSHVPTLKLEKRYINTGIFGYGRKEYLQINKGKMELIREMY